MEFTDIASFLRNLSWADRGAIIGTVSGLAGLYFNWRTRAEMKASKRPILAISQQQSRIWPNGFLVRLRSRSNVGWTAAKLRVLLPSNALVSVTPDSGTIEKLRTIDPRLKVANEGRASKDGYTSDNHQVMLLLYAPSKREPRKLPCSFRVWMLVTLVDETGKIRWRIRCPKFTFKPRD